MIPCPNGINAAKRFAQHRKTVLGENSLAQGLLRQCSLTHAVHWLFTTRSGASPFCGLLAGAGGAGLRSGAAG